MIELRYDQLTKQFELLQLWPRNLQEQRIDFQIYDHSVSKKILKESCSLN
jgi:hypothetical protein